MLFPVACMDRCPSRKCASYLLGSRLRGKCFYLDSLELVLRLANGFLILLVSA